MKEISVGLIGTGYMGKCHALAWGSVKAVFGNVITPKLEILCDIDEETARTRAKEFGFSRWTTDWQEVISSESVDVVSITSPNSLHQEMVEYACEHGKAIWCEKPLALTLDSAHEMMKKVQNANVISLVGYGYLHNPAIKHAKKLIDDGAIGTVIQFRGFCDEDYMADPEIPYTWRCRIADAGTGTLGDLTVHLISIAQFFLGNISKVVGDIQTIHIDRPNAETGTTGKVENDDQANALLYFSSGVQGTIASSRVAWGRKNHLGFEIHGSKGMITFDQERLNELRIYKNEGETGNQGFTTILTGPSHPPYERFVPSAGHSLGFNELKVIELANLLHAIDGKAIAYPDIKDAYSIEQVIHGIVRSSNEGKWVNI